MILRAWHWHRTTVAPSARRVTLGATLVLWLLVTRGRLWLLFARGSFSTDFYDAQACVFLRLHLDVPPGVAGIEGFLVHGRTYLYYGPFLAVLRLPFALFGDVTSGRLSAASLLLGFFVVCTATWHLAVGVARMVGGGSARRSTALVAAVAASPLLGLAGWNSVYDETELWACALALVALAAGVHLLHRPSVRLGVVAASAAGCSFLTRSSVGLGALLGVWFVASVVRRERRVAATTAVVAMGGLLVGVAINLAKFASLFGLPAGKQVLAMQDPSRAAWFAGNHGSFFGLRFIPTTVLQYFRPDAIRLERLVPIVRFGPLARNLGSYPLLGNTPAASLPDAAPLLLAGAVVGLVVMVRRRQWALAGLWAGTVVATVPTFAIGFLAYRYLSDLMPILILPAAVAAATIARPRWSSERAALAAFAVAAVGSLWVNTALGLWVQNLKAPGFTEMRYAIDDAVFGGNAPSALRIHPGIAVPRDGVVGVDGACDGLYIAEQGAWVPLELADGKRVLRGAVDVADLPASIRMADGNVTISPVDDGISVSYEPASGGTITGPRLIVSRTTTVVTVTTDPILGHFAVELDGRSALFAFVAPSLKGASIDQSIRLYEPRNRTEICASIERRLPSSG